MDLQHLNDVHPDFHGTGVSTIRLMHELSRERQPLYCDVIVGKQIIFN